MAHSIAGQNNQTQTAPTLLSAAAMQTSSSSSSSSAGSSSCFFLPPSPSAASSAPASSSLSSLSCQPAALQQHPHPATASYMFSTAAANESSAMPPASKKALDISNLMSPPEAEMVDSFSVCSSISVTGASGQASALPSASRPLHEATKGLDNGPLSPPISPKAKKPVSAASSPSSSSAAQAPRDPILYPSPVDAFSAASTRPLFAADDVPTTAVIVAPINGDADTDAAFTVVSGHMAARSPALFSRTPPPSGEDYALALYLKSEVMKRYITDRRGWLKKEREQLLADRRAAADWNKRLQVALPYVRRTSVPRPFAPRVSRQLQSLPQHMQQQQQQQPQNQHQHQHQNRQHDQHVYQQQQQQQQPVFLQHLHQHPHAHQHSLSPFGILPSHDGSNRVAKRVNRTNLPSRASLQPRIAMHTNNTQRQPSAGHGTSRMPGVSPEPRIRTSAPNREDKDFMSLPDYCPPLSTLPERTNNLKVDWKGNALDLSRDNHAHLLHRDELGLAASLRLDCATYLTSKRRIFIRRLECARIGKEFRKTDAQQACKIDVNKASKLWTAYEKVGWLRPEHIQRFV